MTDGNNDKTAKSKADLKREFAHRFGMLKGQRMHDQAERLTVEAEVMSSNLESAAASAVIEKEESQTGDSSFEHILPPRNVNAALVILHLYLIIPKHAYNIFLNRCPLFTISSQLLVKKIWNI